MSFWFRFGWVFLDMLLLAMIYRKPKRIIKTRGTGVVDSLSAALLGEIYIHYDRNDAIREA